MSPFIGVGWFRQGDVIKGDTRCSVFPEGEEAQPGPAGIL